MMNECLVYTVCRFCEKASAWFKRRFRHRAV